MDQCRGVAEKKITGAEQWPGQFTVPFESRHVQGKTGEISFELRSSEILLDLRRVEVIPKALLQDTIVGHIAVPEIGPSFAVPNERKNPKVALIFEVEKEDQAFGRIRNSSNILAQSVDQVIICVRSRGLAHHASTSVRADNQATS